MSVRQAEPGSGSDRFVTAGIYIHIPFCRSRCPYCHFISLPMDRIAAEKYQRAVIQEMEIFSASRAVREKVDTIYFGGGTPSLVPATHISEIISACRSNFSVVPDCEISLEANPETLSDDKIEGYLECGVNRISLGAQTFNNRELALLGRRHTSKWILKSVDRLRELGLVNINLDLMLGIPRQTAKSWRENLKRVTEISVPHISVYMLDLEESCPLKRMVENSSLELPEEDLVSDLYLETIDHLTACKFEQYEISNYAKIGYLCRHNLKYWTRAPVYGFGLGSHSFDGCFRKVNHHCPEDYFRLIELGNLPVSSMESIGAQKALQEALFLGLRLTRGVDWIQLQEIYGIHALQKYEEDMKELRDRGLIEWNDSLVRLTRSGMLLANEVFQAFI